MINKDYYWQILPLNILSRNGITGKLVDDLVKVIESHGMMETSDNGADQWTEDLDVSVIGEHVEKLFKTIEDKFNHES